MRLSGSSSHKAKKYPTDFVMLGLLKPTSCICAMGISQIANSYNFVRIAIENPMCFSFNICHKMFNKIILILNNIIIIVV